MGADGAKAEKQERRFGWGSVGGEPRAEGRNGRDSLASPARFVVCPCPCVLSSRREGGAG